MKKISFLLIAFIMSSFTLKEPVSRSGEDKEFLHNYYKETSDNLLRNIKGLNREQLTFKPGEDRWSVAECLEHIILIEKTLFDMARKMIEQPANPERKNEIKTTDEQLISMMNNRSQKAQAPESGVPTGRYSSTSEAIAAFREQRKMIRKYIEKTNKNLRDHISDTPLGPVDAYQFLLFIAAHTSRHTLQIEEVKAHPDFPAGD